MYQAKLSHNSIFGLITTKKEMKQFGITILLTLTSLVSFGQTYGNEWIDYSQKYYKFHIGEDGIYRISQQSLTDAGISVSSINPKHFQLFHNGKEQQIYVSGEADGGFDSGDFIEFIGKKNRGELDLELFRTPKEHTNPYVSLYTDTSTYFLTWNSSPSLFHLTSYYDGNYTGKTGDAYFTYESINGYGSDFYTATTTQNKPLVNIPMEKVMLTILRAH